MSFEPALCLAAMKILKKTCGHQNVTHKFHTQLLYIYILYIEVRVSPLFSSYEDLKEDVWSSKCFINFTHRNYTNIFFTLRFESALCLAAMKILKKTCGQSCERRLSEKIVRYLKYIIISYIYFFLFMMWFSRRTVST